MVNCPKCVFEGKQTCELQPVFAIPREYARQINPIFPDGDLISRMFKECVIVDVGFCEHGHGLVNIKEEVNRA